MGFDPWGVNRMSYGQCSSPSITAFIIFWKRCFPTPRSFIKPTRHMGWPINLIRRAPLQATRSCVFSIEKTWEVQLGCWKKSFEGFFGTKAILNLWKFYGKSSWWWGTCASCSSFVMASSSFRILRTSSKRAMFLLKGWKHAPKHPQWDCTNLLRFKGDENPFFSDFCLMNPVDTRLFWTGTLGTTCVWTSCSSSLRRQTGVRFCRFFMSLWWHTVGIWWKRWSYCWWLFYCVYNMQWYLFILLFPGILYTQLNNIFTNK